MDKKELENARFRTDSKLRWARQHFQEMIDAGSGGSDIERSHLESSLFHLIGAREAFLAELVEYYSLGRIAGEVTLGNVRNALEAQGKSKEEVSEFFMLERDTSSWFSKAKRLRDQAIHKGAPPHHFSLHLGGGNPMPGPVKVAIPMPPDATIPRDPNLLREFIEECTIDRNVIITWIEKMSALIDRLRSKAIARNNLNQ